MYYLVEFVGANFKFAPRIMKADELAAFFDNLQTGEALPMGIWRLDPYKQPVKLFLSFSRDKRGKANWYLQDQYKNMEPLWS